jgi:hypothetical protein
VDIERRAALSPKMGNSVSVPSATALGGSSSRGPSTQDAADDSKDRSDDQLDGKLEYENYTQSTTRDIARPPPVSNSTLIKPQFLDHAIVLSASIRKLTLPVLMVQATIAGTQLAVLPM